MKLIISRKLLAIIATFSFILSVCIIPAKAATITTKDVLYYNTTYDLVVNSINSILKDEAWKRWIKVSEAENGTKIEWKNAVRNVRVESGMEESVNLDGFHAVFSELSGSDDTSIGFTFVERRQYSDFIDVPMQNNLARLPLVINLDMKTGSVYVYTAKAFHTQNNEVYKTTVIENNDNLKYAALAGKQWEFRVDYNKDSEKWIIDIAGEKAIVEYEKFFDVTSEIDYTKVYFAVNAWKPGNNNFSLVWNTQHGGDSACADEPSSQGLLNAASNLIKEIDSIGAVTANKGEKIKNIRTLYDNMPRTTKTLIKNYNIFVIKENAYNVVSEIDKLKTPTALSGKEIAKIDEAFAKLLNEEKIEVTNYNKFIDYKTQYQKLKLKELTESENVKTEDVYITTDTIETNLTTENEVDGGTNVTKKTNTITTSGLDGTQYLWIIFTVAGGLLAALAAIFVIVFIKNKKRRGL